MQNKLIYLAGPITPVEDLTLEQNVRTALEVGVEVHRLGGIPIIPQASAPIFFEKGIENEWTHLDYLNRDFEIIKRCWAILLLPNWRKSVGAKMEYSFARGAGIKIYEYQTHPTTKESRIQFIDGGVLN